MFLPLFSCSHYWYQAYDNKSAVTEGNTPTHHTRSAHPWPRMVDGVPRTKGTPCPLNKSQWVVTAAHKTGAQLILLFTIVGRRASRMTDPLQRQRENGQWQNNLVRLTFSLRLQPANSRPGDSSAIPQNGVERYMRSFRLVGVRGWKKSKKMEKNHRLRPNQKHAVSYSVRPQGTPIGMPSPRATTRMPQNTTLLSR